MVPQKTSCFTSKHERKKSGMTYCSAPVFRGGLWGRSLYRVAHKFLLLVWYTDDAFVTWWHRAEKLMDLWTRQYTDNRGTWDSLPAWISVATETKDVCFGCKVYRKAIGTNEYLNATSHDHPASKHSLLCTVGLRAKTTFDQDSRQAELDTLQTTSQRPQLPPQHVRPPQHYRTTVAFLTGIQYTFYRLSRVVSNHLQDFCLPLHKIFGLPRPVKDDLALKSPGVRNIPFMCGECTLGRPIYISRSGSRNTSVIFDYTSRKSHML
jgi:hypothetical protein